MRKSEIDVDGAKKQLNALMPERFKTPMTEQLEKCKNVGKFIFSKAFKGSVEKGDRDFT